MQENASENIVCEMAAIPPGGHELKTESLLYGCVSMAQNQCLDKYPESKVHMANMGPTWVLSAPDGPMLPLWTLLSG